MTLGMEDIKSLKHKHAAEALLDLATDCDISPRGGGGDWNQVMTEDGEDIKQTRTFRSVLKNQERTKRIKLEDDAAPDSDYENNLVIDIDCDSSSEENDALRKTSSLESSMDDSKPENVSHEVDATDTKKLICPNVEESKNLRSKWLKLKKSRKKRKSLKRFLRIKPAKTPKMEIYDDEVEDRGYEEEDEEDEHEKKSYNGKSVDKNECPICLEKFDNVHSFTLHIREHNTDKTAHVCKICSKKLSSASSLDRHMYVHSGERPFECKICNLRFTTNGNMHRHMKTHETATGEKLKGKTNGKRSGSTKGSSSTSENNSCAPSENDETEDCSSSKAGASVNKSSKCMVCSKEFLSLLSLQRHMQMHTNDPIKCTTCSVTSKNYTEYLKHTCPPGNRESHNDADNTKIGFHDLTFLEFSSSKFPLVARNICEKESRNPSSLFFSWECKTCAKAFPSDEALNGHEISHENGGMSCETCRCDFSTTKCFEKHQLKHRKLEDISHTASSEDEKQKEAFLNSLGLCRVQGVRSKVKTCRDLPHFDSIGYFAQQKLPLPTVETMKYSTETTNDFADIGSIISLTSKAPLPDLRASPVTATPASPLQATAGAVPILPMMEESLADLIETDTPIEGVASASQRNELSPRSDTFGKFCCRKCPEQFASLVDLKQHSHSHNKISAVHSCKFCSYESNDKSTLKRHLRRHNGEHPFKCSICDYVFTTKANGIRHVRNKHKLADQDASDAVVYNPNMLESKDSESETNSNETVCKYCKVDFKYNRVLKHHLRSVNNSCSFKPFSCGVCKGGFSTKNNCIRHIINHHPKHKDMAKKLVLANQICVSSPTNSEDGLSGSDVQQHEISLNEDDSRDLSSRNDMSNGAMSLDGDQGETVQVQNDIANGNKSLRELQEPVSRNRSPIFLVQELLNKVTEELDRSKGLVSDDSPTSSSPSSESQEHEAPQPLNLALNIDGKRCGSVGNKSYSSDDAEMVSAAESLICLQGMTPLQESPLDLTVSALNLSVKREQFFSPETADVRRRQDVFNASKRESSVSSPAGLSENAKPPAAHASSDKQTSIAESPAIKSLPPLCLVSKADNSTTPASLSSLTPVRSPAKGLKPPHAAVSQALSTCVGSSADVEKGKGSQKVKRFLCEICFKGFTLKSNRERHIKNHHPEYARPPRSRNYLPTLSPIGVHKQNGSTLSDKTRDALRVAIIAKTNNGMPKMDKNSEFLSTPPTTHSSSEESCPVKQREDENSSNRADVHDLASVSEVIDTVNCQSFKEYLNQAKELPTVVPRKPARNTNTNLRNGNVSVKTKKNSYARGTKGILCMFCKRRFPWKSSLSRHLLTHTGVKPHRCPKCPISFTTKSNRDRHLFRQHKDMDSKPYRCTICTDSSFSTRSKLKKHNQTVHKTVSRDDTTELLHCSKDVTDASSGESDDAQESIDCHVCGTSCKTQHDLLKHLKQLHPMECDDGVGEEQPTFPRKIKTEPEDPDHKDSVNHCCDKCLLPFATEDEQQSHRCSADSTIAPVVNAKKSAPKLANVLPKKSSNSLLYLFAAAQHARSVDNSTEEPAENRNGSSEKGDNLILDLLGFKDPDFLEEMLDSAVRSRVKKEVDS